MQAACAVIMPASGSLHRNQNYQYQDAGGTFMPLSRNHTYAISEDTFFDGSALPLRSIAKSGRERIDSKQKLEQTIRLDSLKPSRSAQPDTIARCKRRVDIPAALDAAPRCW